MSTFDCQFITRRRRSGILVELCELNLKPCLVALEGASSQHCTRRAWALDLGSSRDSETLSEVENGPLTPPG